MSVYHIFIIFIRPTEMKAKGEPCINNYLTVHVPAATLLNEYRSKKKEKQSEDKNPFRNQKLQMMRQSKMRKNDINCVYTSLPNKSFGKKKKVQQIPLLKNIRLNDDMKLRIVRETNKNVYNLVFEKKSMRSCQNLLRRDSGNFMATEASKRSIITQQTGRNLKTSDSSRKISYPVDDYRYSSSPIKIDSVHWPLQMTKSTQLRISGNKAPTCETVDHLRKSSKSSPKKNLLYQMSNHHFEEYI